MIVLVIPPVSDCFMPTLGVAQIAGYLKEANVDCKVYDIGAEINYKIYEKVLNENERIKNLIIGDNGYTYRNLVSSMNFFSLTNEDFEIGADYFNIGCDWKDVDLTIEYISSENLLSNMYTELPLISEIGRWVSQVICGISISYESQVIPSLILAKILKSKFEEVRICLGGSLLYNFEEIFYKYVYVSNLIDYLVIGPGEIVFEQIEKPNFVDLIRSNGIKITEFDERLIIDARESINLPVVYKPNFEDFNFELYPVENKAFPYMIKDKCYYGKCRFCNGDKVMRKDNCKAVESAFTMIQEISKQTNIANAYIVDAALSPRDFVNIGKMSSDNMVSWIANARFEKKLTDENLIKEISRKGCVMLRFGFESGSQKVLDFMNKGTKVDIAEKILALTSKYNIKNHLYIMFGYPGEGKKERKETLDFLDRNKRYIYSYSVSVFQPIPGTPVYEELSEKLEARDNEYERIIELVYPNENDYQELREDILRAGDILKDFAQTNIEYYSANIFNTDAKKKKRYTVIEYTEYLRCYSDIISISDKIVVEEITDKKRIEYVYLDFYNKIIVFLLATKEVVDSLEAPFVCDEHRVGELKMILDNSRVHREYKNFIQSDLKRNIFNEMSIQFMP